MPALEMETISEVEIFAELENLDDHVGCSYNDCDKPAVNFLVCGEEGCDAAETICAHHSLLLLVVQMSSTTATITFDNTCGHEPFIHECDIKPMP